jgi:hypothetical protein
MGFRFGLRLGPFSASTRIGGGGGGGSQGPGWDSLDEMVPFVFWLGVCGAAMVWVWEHDDGKIILWWVLLQALPFVVILTAHMALVHRLSYGLLLNYPKGQYFPWKPTMLTNALFALVSPVFYLLGFHTIPLAVRDRGDYVTEVAITASITSWLSVLIPVLILPETLLISKYIWLKDKEDYAQKDEIRKQKEKWERHLVDTDEELYKNQITTWAENRTTQKVRDLYQRQKAEERHIREHNAQVELKKVLDKKIFDTNEALSRLESVTEQAFSQRHLSAGNPSLREIPSLKSLEENLIIAFADVDKCISECKSLSEKIKLPNYISRYEKGLATLRAELVKTFGFENL